MLIVSQIKVPCGSGKQHVEEKLSRILGRKPGTYKAELYRHSVDARKKPELFDVYSFAVHLSGGEEEEKALAAKRGGRNITWKKEVHYDVPSWSGPLPENRPVVVGSGPAGLFAGLILAETGLSPIILERGKKVEERTRDVEHFFAGGPLNEDSNIQFGEGGAGTYSDGKLTTNVKDKEGRTEFILDTFIAAGADPSIACEALPHIGTDALRGCVASIRKTIESLGGTYRFETRMEDVVRDGDRLTGLRIRDLKSGEEEILPCSACILAPGHSARTLIRTLCSDRIPMEAKSFAVGLRVSHPQGLLNGNQYGISNPSDLKALGLPAVSYKLTAKASSGRGVYSFCMCPGGYIVNASSEKGRLAVNGMSDFARNSRRANSAVVVTVGPEEYGTSSVLDGLAFQEKLEEKAYAAGQGSVPIERYQDYAAGAVPENAGQEADSEALCIRGRAVWADLHDLLPEGIRKDFIEGMTHFDRVIPGFAGGTCFVAGIESRTSSPVRLARGEDGMSPALQGLYPCGEGAGYAGGIMSAAIDGMKTAEKMIRNMRTGSSQDGTLSE